MKGLQKVSGVGALLLAVSFVLLIVGNVVVASRLDATSSSRIVGLIQILFAVGFTLTAPGLNDRLQERSPNLMRIATASGLGGAVLFLATGMFNFGAPPAAVGDVGTALIRASIFAAGWWALLASWAGLQGGLPKILSYLGLLFGAAAILSFAIPPFNPLSALFGIVWSAWLGITLLREK